MSDLCETCKGFVHTYTENVATVYCPYLDHLLKVLGYGHSVVRCEKYEKREYPIAQR